MQRINKDMVFQHWQRISALDAVSYEGWRNAKNTHCTINGSTHFRSYVIL